MPSPKLRSIKRKVSLLAVGAVALTVVLLGAVLVVVLDRFVEDAVGERLTTAHATFLEKLNARAQANLFLATTMARAPVLAERIQSGDREGMRPILAPIFDQLRTDFAIDNLHFHTADGRSFLRMHEPERFGDSLADKRRMIAEVNATRGQASGIEWGVYGLVIRGMRAIVTTSGAHIGSVEVGSFITDRLLTDFASPGVRLTIYSNQPQALGGKPLDRVQRLAASGGRTGAKLHAQDLAALEGTPGPIRPQRLEDGTSGLTQVFALRDWSGAIIGAVQICVDARDLLRLRMLVGTAVVLLGLLGMAIAYVLARQLSRTVTQPILALSDAISRIAADDLSMSVPEQSRDDEVGVIARKLDTLRDALILARRKEALLRHRDRLQSLGDMTGRIAHELNNLLQPIRLTVELLEEAPAPEPIREQVGLIGRSVERARTLLADILAFARRDGHNPAKADLPTAPLAEAMDAALTLVRAAQASNQEIRADGPWPRARVACDPAGLSQVVLNICRNGFDAMGGSGRIDITATGVEITEASSKSAVLAPGAYIRIDIQDHGPGIPADILDRLFEPFFTTKPAGKGTGLGLSIAYSMVQEWGGHIGVRTALGVGSIFEIYLPVTAADGGPDPRPSSGRT